MTWVINPTVTINGTDYTGETLQGATVNSGRTNIYEQPRASYATVEILNYNVAAYDIDVKDDLTITVDNATGSATITLFSGKIVSISNSIQNMGDAATVCVQRISAVSQMSDMARIIIGDTAWSKEYDDDRMTRIFNDAGVVIDTVDTPGIYEFTARSANPIDAYSAAAQYAGQAFGYIYDTPSGAIGYANEARRRNDVAASGYQVIPNSCILWADINSEKTGGNLVNDVLLTYKNNQTVTSSDASSQATYGYFAASFNTELENTTEAQYQADRYIALRAIPKTNLAAFTLVLTVDTLTNSELNYFLAMEMGKAIEIDNLPYAIKNQTYKGFVEGYTFNVSRNKCFLTLTTSDAVLSITPTRWQDVSASLIWSAVDPAVTWSTYE